MDGLERHFLKHIYETAEAATEEDVQAWLVKAWDICREAFDLEKELLVDLRDATSFCGFPIYRRRTVTV